MPISLFCTHLAKLCTFALRDGVDDFVLFLSLIATLCVSWGNYVWYKRAVADSAWCDITANIAVTVFLAWVILYYCTSLAFMVDVVFYGKHSKGFINPTTVGTSAVTCWIGVTSQLGPSIRLGLCSVARHTSSCVVTVCCGLARCTSSCVLAVCSGLAGCASLCVLVVCSGIARLCVLIRSGIAGGLTTVKLGLATLMMLVFREVTRLRSSIADLVILFGAANAKTIAALEADNARLVSALVDIEASHRRGIRRNLEYSVKLADSQAAASAYQSECQRLDRYSRRLGCKFRNARLIIATLQRKLRRCRQALSAETTNVNQTEALQAVPSTPTIEDLTSSLERAQADLENAGAAHADALASKDAEIDRLKAELRDARSQHDTAQQSIASLRSELQVVRESGEKASAKVTKLETDKAELKATIERQASNLRDSNDAHHNEQCMLSNKNKESKARIKRLEATVTRQVKELAQRERMIAARDDQISAFAFRESFKAAALAGARRQFQQKDAALVDALVQLESSQSQCAALLNNSIRTNSQSDESEVQPARVQADLHQQLTERTSEHESLKEQIQAAVTTRTPIPTSSPATSPIRPYNSSIVGVDVSLFAPLEARAAQTSTDLLYDRISLGSAGDDSWAPALKAHPNSSTISTSPTKDHPTTATTTTQFEDKALTAIVVPLPPSAPTSSPNQSSTSSAALNISSFALLEGRAAQMSADLLHDKFSLGGAGDDSWAPAPKTPSTTPEIPSSTTPEIPSSPTTAPATQFEDIASIAARVPLPPSPPATLPSTSMAALDVSSFALLEALAAQMSTDLLHDNISLGGAGDDSWAPALEVRSTTSPTAPSSPIAPATQFEDAASIAARVPLPPPTTLPSTSLAALDVSSFALLEALAAQMSTDLLHDRISLGGAGDDSWAPALKVRPSSPTSSSPAPAPAGSTPEASSVRLDDSSFALLEALAAAVSTDLREQISLGPLAPIAEEGESFHLTADNVSFNFLRGSCSFIEQDQDSFWVTSPPRKSPPSSPHNEAPSIPPARTRTKTSPRPLRESTSSMLVESSVCSPVKISTSEPDFAAAFTSTPSRRTPSPEKHSAYTAILESCMMTPSPTNARSQASASFLSFLVTPPLKSTPAQRIPPEPTTPSPPSKRRRSPLKPLSIN